MTDVVVILTTVPDGKAADTIARALVEEQLAACVNILPPMTSVYRWRGAVERETEQQLMIKTVRPRVAAVQTRIAEIHPYELPEFVVLDVIDGSPGYLEWIIKETSPSPVDHAS
jgi:periplasmic divalent cation tolerance protein